MSIQAAGNKFIAVICICIVLMSSFLVGCPALDDWNYCNLPNDYSIVRVNGSDTHLCKRDGQLLITQLDRYVVAFCYNERYIGIQRIPVETPYSEVITFEDLDQSKVEFYFVDSETDTILGPWTLEQFNNKIDQCGIFDMNQWISTETRPAGAE